MADLTILSFKSKGFFAKKALIGYLPESCSLPRDHPNFVGHSNFQECRALVHLCVEQGYSCDLVHWQADLKSLPRGQYDLFIGLHHQLAEGKSLVKKNGKVVLYATAAHWLNHNAAEHARLIQLKIRQNIVLLPRRQLAPVLFEKEIDEIWHLGNDFQKASYAHLNRPLYRVPLSTVEVLHPPIDINAANKKSFLWFGSVGAVHKGLDWLLEIFSRSPELTLHVCGLVALEEDFIKFFSKELFHSPNIHFHGWVLPNTTAYQEICQQCAFVISPSASEGGGGALLQCMRMGLVPLGTPGCSVDLKDSGFMINIDSLEETAHIIHAVAKLPIDVLVKKSIQARQQVEARHTLETYQAAVRHRLCKLS